MKDLAVVLVVLVLLLAVGGLTAAYLDPDARAQRAYEHQLARQQAAELAPLWLDAKRALILGAGIGGAAFLIGVGIASLGLGIGALRWALVRSHLVHAQRGIFPALVPVFGNAYALPANPPAAAIGQSIFDGRLNRLSAPVLRQLMEAPVEEIALPPAAPALPAHASIYAAPIPHHLALPIGVEATGGPLAVPLLDMGSVVIGGLQGMGKSEAIASMIAGLLRQDASGARARITVIDLKGGLDFGHIPADLAALQWPVARDADGALATMRATWVEVERRQQLLFAARAAHLDTYNARCPAADRLPYLAVIIDELAMMTMPAGERTAAPAERAASDEFISLLVRAAAVGRALGVSVIAATQRPSSDVIPVRFRDICGLRLAFRCSTDHQSRAVLGIAGAEALPNEPGRALLMIGDKTPVPLRSYCAEVKAGRFLNFVEQMPRRAAVQDAVHEPVYRAYASEMPISGGIPPAEPLSVPQDRPPDTDDLRYHVYRRWRALGSLSAVEWELYQQKGGVKFYWVRDCINIILSRKGQSLISDEAA